MPLFPSMTSSSMLMLIKYLCSNTLTRNDKSRMWHCVPGYGAGFDFELIFPVTFQLHDSDGLCPDAVITGLR